ncbi:MAG TPA: AraC family transcriptional regulator [Polyangiaceae bacterium]|nr:AraC family transcriptional regulator [Polyangiaceae bacterium]
MAVLQGLDFGPARSGVGRTVQPAARGLWEMARESVDVRTEHIWTSLANRIRLEELGVLRAPGHAIVGLLASRSDPHDEFEDFLQRRAFQRACVSLAWEQGNVISGRVGDHGVVFLLPPERSERSARARLLRVGARAQELARKFELSLHLGVGSSPRPAPLSVRYQRALGAAERALSTGAGTADAAEDSERTFGLLRELREKLAQQWQKRPAELRGRFDRYLEAVAAHAGYQLEPARAHVEAGFERLTEPLLSTGALDEKSLLEIYAALDRASQSATTLNELFSAYRVTVSDIESALTNTTGAHQERSLRRAIEFVKEHAAEPLPLSSVARLAGFAPNYFARLFKEREGMSLAHYVRNLRLRHAQRLLDRTPLPVARIGQLSGFSSKHHFHRVFRSMTGMTPAEYRQRS